MATIVTRAGKGSPLTNAEVDANFNNLNNQLATALFGANNLSDLASVPTARSNLGLAIGTNVQAWDADLDAIAALAGSSGLLKKTAANTWTLDTSAYLTGITSGQVTTALGYTPYNATNPSGYITSSSLSSYLPLSGGTLTGALTFASAGAVLGTGTYSGNATFSGNLTLSGTSTISGQVNTAANAKITLATGLAMFHDTANAYMDMVTGSINIRNGAGTLRFTLANGGDFTATGNVTAYSDETLKTNWRSVGDGFIERLAGVKRGIYDRIDGGVTQVGCSAQSLRQVLPDAVLENEHGILSVAYGNAALLSVIEVADELVRLKQYVKSKLG